MSRAEILPVLLADAPGALVEVCGISLLERLLRTLQRLGFGKAVILSSTPEIIRAEIAKPSWPRQEITVVVRGNPASAVIDPNLFSQPSASRSILLLPGDIYCDPRLLEKLGQQGTSAVLVDSGTPTGGVPSKYGQLCGPALLTKNSFPIDSSSGVRLLEELKNLVENGQIDVVDAASENAYIASMRQHVRPVCFPAASPSNQRLAKRAIFDSSQKGSLDLPAYVHAPIEKWLISHLCRTKITPNQITLMTALSAVVVTVQFLFGWLVSGTLLAMLVGILDGLDGKQARVKVETTELGKWEHKVDAVFEISWWIALALHFWATGLIPNALWLVGILLGAHIVDGRVRRMVERVTGRSIDDVSTFDRIFRLIGGRRNTYIWLFAISLLVGAPDKGFVSFCILGVVTAIVHAVRTIWICTHTDRVTMKSGNPPRH